jgi:hypothetical protein
VAQLAEGEPPALRSLRVHPSATHTAAERLAEDTAAQIVRLVGDDYLIQIAIWIPAGQRASVARHLAEMHLFECCTRSCKQARQWAAEVAAPTPLEPPTVVSGCTALPA